MNIGKRERIANIRDLWKKETDFSDWLITEEGIELLSQDLGVQIEGPTRECRTGDYPCDIVAHLAGDDESHVVVIENQYGRTNHDHLGKFLTYASVNKAMTGIWIAEEASDDHRQVIDWLNENTPPSVNLYLVELKAFRIGDSPAAPMLDAVCRPNASQKAARSGKHSGEAESDAWRLAYWEAVHNKLREAKPPFRLPVPTAYPWSVITFGRSGFHIAMVITPSTHNIRIQLVIEPVGWRDSAYRQLLGDKDAIEAEAGEPLHWVPSPEKQRSRVILEAPIDPRPDSNRDAVCQWFAEKLPRMYRVFKERVMRLRPEPLADGETDE